MLTLPLGKQAKPRILAAVANPLPGQAAAGTALRAGHFLVHGVKMPIAQVDFGARQKRGDAGYMAAPAVIVGVQKQPSADTVSLTRAVEAQLAAIQKSLPSGVSADKIQFRQATFIETSIASTVPTPS